MKRAAGILRHRSWRQPVGRVVVETKAFFSAELHGREAEIGKRYGQIAEETGFTNVYVAQLFRHQALTPITAPKLRSSLTGLTDVLIHEMMQSPLRSYDPNIIQDPTIYRFQS
ncbi:hypothetical protein CASFOL_005815 [Castilleja foliolosa]|uniref:Uncharacterized protein n=1 Tax=Castilleja foliolosa TaxID=1961234 RepID=A0ABD3E5L0_9LAMI